MKIPTPSDSPSDIKASVSLAGVVMACGVPLTMELSGDYVGLCPWHNDSTPSLSIYGGGSEQRWNCWACGISGDVFDFVSRMYGDSFPEAKRRVITVRDGGQLPDPPVVSERYRATAEEMQGVLDTAGDQVGCMPELIVERGINVPMSWLREWGVRADNVYVFIPHYSEDGSLVGLKRRWHMDWIPTAMPGSDLSNLYGSWRDNGNETVVICEGESDTWLVSYLLRDRPIDVLGLPHGVCAPTPSWLAALTGRKVVLLFDADPAGRSAIRSWLDTLPNLSIAILPDGSDCNSTTPDTVLAAVTEAREWKSVTGIPISTADGRYWTAPSTGTGAPISDFIFDIRRLVELPDNIEFEVMVPGHATAQFISGTDLLSAARMRDWCTRRLLIWKGSDKNLADLLELLKASSVLVPNVKGTDVVGLHGDVYVLPTFSIGASGWGYAPPENDVHLSEFLRIEEGPWDLDVIAKLALLHSPSIISPLLGWIAAAPFRSLFQRFPILSVTGGSGFGKTTLVKVTLETFGFWIKSPPTLTGSTPHAVLSYASSTNAFPIWFDEYRPGARPDARMALDQVIRDAWDGSSTIKGGMYDSRMKIKAMPACAPLIVTGEDAFTETSHVERMVCIEMPMKGKNPNALQDVLSSNNSGLGYAYLQWALNSMRTGNLRRLPNLADRAEHGLAVAEWGYHVLGDFTEEVCGYELEPTFDGSSCIRTQKEAADRPVILEAIELTAGRESRPGSGDYITYIDNDGTGYVRPQALVEWCQQHSDIKLPGGSRAVQRWLVEVHGARSVRHKSFGRVLEIPHLRERLEDGA